jgi:hypothetical protein
LKANRQLDELTKERNIINYVKSSKIRNRNRMSENSIVKQICKWKPFTRRAVGRPKSRWEDDVRNGLKKMELVNGLNKSKTALNGRILLRRPRLYHSCSAIEEEGEPEVEYFTEVKHEETKIQQQPNQMHNSYLIIVLF